MGFHITCDGKIKYQALFEDRLKNPNCKNLLKIFLKIKLC